MCFLALDGITAALAGRTPGQVVFRPAGQVAAIATHEIGDCDVQPATRLLRGRIEVGMPEQNLDDADVDLLDAEHQLAASEGDGPGLGGATGQANRA